MKYVLITGAAGFIGAALTERLLSEDNDYFIVGIDNLNDYYDVGLKNHRLSKIEALLNKTIADRGRWKFIKGDISDRGFIEKLFDEIEFDIVVNLAAQAGVRYSIDHPRTYINSNIMGFFNIIEACRNQWHSKGIDGHLIFASSSSVYGEDGDVPFKEDQMVDRPVSLYAATKKSDELIAYSYSKIYGMMVTGLRFFTVYGPAGRPDMAYFSTDKLVKGKDIQVFNNGNMKRDFTYIDDVIESIVRIMKGERRRDSLDNVSRYSIYNIGHGSPIDILEFVTILQEELMRVGVLSQNYDFDSHKKLVGMQKGDVSITYSSTEKLERNYGYKPVIGLRDGLRNFAVWYKAYYMAG